MGFQDFITYLAIYIGLVATIFYILVFVKHSKKPVPLYTDEELPKVSILIPAYNEEKTIAATIESISKSDYPKGKLEIIVIDDGSKDKTYSIAKKFAGKNIRVFTKPNGGKGTALNFALSKAKGEIVFSMDADTFVEPYSVKKMVRYFKNPEVMGVSPSIVLHNPKSILQKIQQMEYLLGIFLRKAFSGINAIHISPGAFSAYRKSFFDKYGGYDVGNITEDLELAMRIQANGFRIESCVDAPAYTVAPSKFMPLLVQRRRWYIGLIKNTWTYKRLFNPKFGDMGVFVLPVAWISIFFAMYMTIKAVLKAITTVKIEMSHWASINYDISTNVDFGWLALKKVFYYVFSDPVNVFLLVFISLLLFYIHYAGKKVGKRENLTISLLLFFIFFAFLFGFWWIVSYIHSIFSKRVSWR